MSGLLKMFKNCFRSENIKKTHSMWLLAPLISKLPSAVQGRVLKVAGNKSTQFTLLFLNIKKIVYLFLIII